MSRSKEDNVMSHERDGTAAVPSSFLTARLAQGGGHDRLSSRRQFFHKVGLLAFAGALAQAPEVLKRRGWLPAACAGGDGELRDTVCGLAAFIVPGLDAFSVHQGASTPEPGAIDAGITDILIQAFDLFVPFLPSFSATIAAILNGVALAVNPTVTGPFASRFANLSFAEKGAVFEFLESDPALRALAGALPQFVAFVVYSEAGAIDPATGVLTGTPLGWSLSGYEGIADGRDELKGYFQNRKKVD
jgi:hypothetical protein